MATLKERKRRGEDTVRRYRALSGDRYESATDAIADILLYVAQTEDESTQILQAAEVDFRNTAESETFLTEG